jgi:hypothetical protein
MTNVIGGSAKTAPLGANGQMMWFVGFRADSGI